MLEIKLRSKLAQSNSMHGLRKASSRDSINEPSSSGTIDGNQLTASKVIPTVLEKLSTITESSVLKKLPKEHIRLEFVEKLKHTLHSGYIASYKSTKYFSPLKIQSVISSAREQQATTRHTSTTTTTQSPFPHYPYSSFNDINAYKKNEFYSIFVSVLTAAAFLFFIMWRWFKMRSDLKRSLQEQEQIQQHERSELNTNTNQDDCVDRISGTSNNGIRWPNNGGRYMLIANNREELQNYAATLINQLSNGDYRTPREHQQMIDTARYCLQQLKLHARLTQHYRLQNNGAYYGRNSGNYYHNNYSTFNSNRRDRRSNASYGSTASSAFMHDYSPSSQSLNQQAPVTFNLPPAPPASFTSLTSSCTNDFVNFRLGPSTHGSVYNSTLSTNIPNQAKSEVHNEPPPAYESLLVKSSSLPSYCNLSDSKEDTKKECYDKSTSHSDNADKN